MPAMQPSWPQMSERKERPRQSPRKSSQSQSRGKGASLCSRPLPFFWNFARICRISGRHLSSCHMIVVTTSRMKERSPRSLTELGVQRRSPARRTMPPRRTFSDCQLSALAWCCCLLGCLMFGGILIGTTGLLQGMAWMEDMCTVYHQNDECLVTNSPGCRVSVDVFIMGNPVRSHLWPTLAVLRTPPSACALCTLISYKRRI